MQWTNAAVFDKKVQAKVQAMEETAKLKRQAKDDFLKNKVVEHVYGGQQPAAKPSQTTAPREIVVNDLRFRVATDGSKLIRVFGEKDDELDSNYRLLSKADGPQKDPHSTPKEAKLAGVTFMRTKNGNMIRQGLLKNKRCSRRIHDSQQKKDLPQNDRVDAGKVQKKLCPEFTSNGTRIFHPLARPLFRLLLLCLLTIRSRVG